MPDIDVDAPAVPRAPGVDRQSAIVLAHAEGGWGVSGVALGHDGLAAPRGD